VAKLQYHTQCTSAVFTVKEAQLNFQCRYGSFFQYKGLITIIIIIIIKGIYIAQVHKGHKCAMSAEMAVWLRNCVCHLRSLISLKRARNYHKDNKVSNGIISTKLQIHI